MSNHISKIFVLTILAFCLAAALACGAPATSQANVAEDVITFSQFKIPSYVPVENLSVPLLSLDSHTLEVQEQDNSGNWSESGIKTIKIKSSGSSGSNPNIYSSILYGGLLFGGFPIGGFGNMSFGSIPYGGSPTIGSPFGSFSFGGNYLGGITFGGAPFDINYSGMPLTFTTTYNMNDYGMQSFGTSSLFSPSFNINSFYTPSVMSGGFNALFGNNIGTIPVYDLPIGNSAQGILDIPISVTSPQIPLPISSQIPLPTLLPTTDLYTCGTRCDIEIRNEVQELKLSRSSMDNCLGFTVYTEANENAIVWQVATVPFEDARSLDADGIVGQGTVLTTGEYSIIMIDFSTLDLIIAGGDDGSDAVTRCYVRVLPMFDDELVGLASNTVVITFQDASGTLEPVVFSHAFEVEIVDFQPLTAPSLPYGCVHIESVDATKLSWYDYQYYSKFVGHTLCPEPYRGEGDPPWYEQMWNALYHAASWPASTYEAAKWYVVNVAADQINSLFDHDVCGDLCRDKMKDTLEYSLVALGVPPELPNAEQIIDNSEEYLALKLAKSVGLEDCEPCVEEIRAGIEAMADELIPAQLAKACGDVELAHNNGREPLCLPPGVVAWPEPASATQPARMTVRIRGTADAETLAPADLDQYQLDLNVGGYNDRYGDGIRVPSSMCFSDNSVYDCYSENSDDDFYALDGPLTGGLFETVTLALPPLHSGQYVDVQVVLTPTDYWIPGHEGGLHNDWNRFYQGATALVSATVSCPHVTFGSACLDSAAIQVPGLHP